MNTRYLLGLLVITQVALSSSPIGYWQRSPPRRRAKPRTPRKSRNAAVHQLLKISTHCWLVVSFYRSLTETSPHYTYHGDEKSGSGVLSILHSVGVD